mmetsp:Transcript_1309/g.1673  ORF Transcript_1309/g.1673 Transcript_1309/m.1673 type:complete len:144 (+) Transcript_1309:325-756(+)
MAQSGDEYKELGCVKWSPLLALVPCFLPCFSNYQVEISGGKLTFGYGPLHCGTTVTVDLEDVEPDSVTEGIATCSDNLFSFGGWGIRYGYAHTDGSNSATKTGIYNYNPYNGTYVQFYRKSNRQYYRFSCGNPQEVKKKLMQK